MQRFKNGRSSIDIAEWSPYRGCPLSRNTGIVLAGNLFPTLTSDQFNCTLVEIELERLQGAFWSLLPSEAVCLLSSRALVCYQSVLESSIRSHRYGVLKIC